MMQIKNNKSDAIKKTKRNLLSFLNSEVVLSKRITGFSVAEFN